MAVIREARDALITARLGADPHPGRRERCGRVGRHFGKKP